MQLLDLIRLKNGTYRAHMESNGVEVSIEEDKYGYQLTLLKGELEPGAANEFYLKMDQIKTVSVDDLALTDETKTLESST